MIHSTSNMTPQDNGQAIARRANEQPPPSRRAPRGNRSTLRVVYFGTALFGLVAMIVAANKIRGATSSTMGAVSSASNAMRVEAFQPTMVTSYHVARSYTGTIVARRSAELGFELPGKIVQVLFDVGDEIESGSPLALLDVAHLKTKREELIARKEQAQSVLDELVAGPRKETIAMAQAEVDSLSSQIELLEVQQARRKRLLEDSAVSRDEYDVTHYSLQARKAELSAATHKLEELTNGTRPEQITAQKAAQKQLSVQIADADIDLQKSVLRAPFAGRIAARFVDEGTVVQAGTPVFQLLEAHALEAWIGVPPHETGQLQAGDERSVTIQGTVYPARVARVLPHVDRGTHTQTVVLSLTGVPDNALADGQIVRLQLDTKVEEQGMWVPTTALEKSSRGLWSCYVLEDSNQGDRSPEVFRIARRYVELLHSDGARALVRGTITPGEIIVSSGTHRNVPGQLVRLERRREP